MLEKFVSDVVPTMVIFEDDLVALERCVPILHEACKANPDVYNRPDLQVAIETCKRILSDVRWGYGPVRSLERKEPL